MTIRFEPNRRLLFSGTLASLLLCSQPAKAQEQSAPSQPDANGALQEIVVTAQKRSENIQNIPIAVSAITGAMLQTRAVNNIQTLTVQIPSLQYGQIDGSTFVTIRGVGTNLSSGIGDPSVSTYVDGIYIPRQSEGSLEQVDLDRVEVLRGPQGTLYGRNSAGGAINFVSVKPSNMLTAGANALYGNYNRVEVDGYVSGPLSPLLALRVSGGMDRQDGYVKNLLPGYPDNAATRDWHVRGALRFTPSATVIDDLSIRYEHQGGSLAYEQAIALPTAFPAGTLATVQPWRIYSPFRPDQDKNVAILANTLDWMVTDHLTLRSITGYVSQKDVFSLDGDAASYNEINVVNDRQPSKSVSQEFDLIGSLTNLKYVLGAYYYHDSFADNNEGQFPFGFAGVFPPGSEYDFGGWFSHTSAYAVFGDATYSVTAKMRIEAGGRYNVERRSYLLDSFLVVPPNPPVYFYNNLPAYSRSDNFLPKLGLQYDLSSRIMAYANWQIGFKSGGVNEGLGADGQPVPYQPEKNHAYEAGIKSRFWDGKATLNVAGYVYAYKNLQVYELINATQQFVQNGDANLKGVEAELDVQLTHYVRINAAGTLERARYTNFTTFDQVIAGQLDNFNGHPLDQAPGHTLSGGVDWTIPFSDRSTLVLRAENYLSGSYVLSPFGGLNNRPGYDLVNLYATLSPGWARRITLRAYVTNLTNKPVLNGVIYSSINGNPANNGQANLGNYAPPRMWGIALNYRL